MTRRAYEVTEVPRHSIAGERLFTVIQTVDGVVRGGDHHWVRRRFAERAAVVYRAVDECLRDDSGSAEQRLRTYRYEDCELIAEYKPGVEVCHHGAPSDVVAQVWALLFPNMGPIFDED